MPYISTEQVAKMRAELKKELPAFKMSVKREHYSMVDVSLLSGPVDFGASHQQVNEFHIASHYQGEPQRILLKIAEILQKDCSITHEDADYGSVPNYYISISIGRWDKPYVKQ